MIAYLNGKIKYKGVNHIVLEVGGVGYKIYVPSGVLDSKQEEAELFIFHYIREDAQDLYGFTSKIELEFFEQLLEVKGVGPKMALNILSQLKINEVKKAILSQEPALLESISGVGRKTAERIILELKNRVVPDEDGYSSYGGSFEELTGALMGLGYSRSEAAKLARKVPSSLESIEEKIKYALKDAK